MTALLVAAVVALSLAVVVLVALLARDRRPAAPTPAAAPGADPGDEPGAPDVPVAERAGEQVPAVVDEVADATVGSGVGRRLQAVVDGLDRGVVLRDARGVEVYRNAAARRFVEARDSHVLVAAAIEELLDEASRGRRVRRVVDLFGPPAQSFVVTAAPFRDAGPAGGDDGAGDEGAQAVDAGAVALVEDRSLQRRTETVRRDFVANISHELKTPVGALGLLAETLRDEVAVDTPDRDAVQRLADRMTVEADRAASTIDDLLELSRIEFGDDTDFERVRLVEVVGEVVSRLGPAAEQAGITVRSDVAGELAVVGDARQLVSALFNLVDNALKYSAEGSEVTVSASRDEDHVLLVVEDHGVGVPRRDLDRIFERFYRVDRARSRETGGTGLGLAIVRHVASNHGGEVLVSSTEGVGSTFTLVLPRDRRAGGDAGGEPGSDDERRALLADAVGPFTAVPR